MTKTAEELQEFTLDRSADAAVFAKAYIPMVTDSRLGDGEFRLLMWLTIRCFASGSCYVGNKRIAKDLGVSTDTICRRMTRLKELKWIRSASRGVNRTDMKVITDPAKMYGDLMLDSFSLLKGPGNQRVIDELRSHGAEVPDFTGTGKYACTGTGKYACSITGKNACTEVDQEEVDQVEEKAASQPDPDPDQDRPITATPDTEAGKVGRWGAASTVVKQAQAKHRRAMDRQDAKKARKKAPSDDAGGDEEKKITANDVEKWFRDGAAICFGGVKTGKWALKDKSNAKMLLDSYGPELVKETVEYLFREWDSLSSSLKLVGLPSVGLLTGYRDTIFGMVQLGETGTKRRGEYDPRTAKDSPSSGWGNLAARVGDDDG